QEHLFELEKEMATPEILYCLYQDSAGSWCVLPRRRWGAGGGGGLLRFSNNLRDVLRPMLPFSCEQAQPGGCHGAGHVREQEEASRSRAWAEKHRAVATPEAGRLHLRARCWVHRRPRDAGGRDPDGRHGHGGVVMCVNRNSRFIFPFRF